MDQHINIIQQVIDQAVKAGLFQNLATVGAVLQSWEKIIAAVNKPQEKPAESNE